MKGNAFEVVPAQDRSGFIRPLLPFALVLFAYLLPTVWAVWSVAALGYKQTIAGIPEYVAFSWFGFVIGAFAACVSIYIGYAYSKSWHRCALATRISNCRCPVSFGWPFVLVLALCPVLIKSPRGQRSNMALDPVPFGHWTLRDEAAQRRSALRWASQ
jgi:hypothetical protein